MNRMKIFCVFTILSAAIAVGMVQGNSVKYSADLPGNIASDTQVRLIFGTGSGACVIGSSQCKTSQTGRGCSVTLSGRCADEGESCGDGSCSGSNNKSCDGSSCTTCNETSGYCCQMSTSTCVSGTNTCNCDSSAKDDFDQNSRTVC